MGPKIRWGPRTRLGPGIRLGRRMRLGPGRGPLINIYIYTYLNIIYTYCINIYIHMLPIACWLLLIGYSLLIAVPHMPIGTILILTIIEHGFGHQSGLYESSRRKSTSFLCGIAFRVYLVLSKIIKNTT